jgi:hypothetical protein
MSCRQGGECDHSAWRMVNGKLTLVCTKCGSPA